MADINCHESTVLYIVGSTRQYIFHNTNTFTISNQRRMKTKKQHTKFSIFNTKEKKWTKKRLKGRLGGGGDREIIIIIERNEIKVKKSKTRAGSRAGSRAEGGGGRGKYQKFNTNDKFGKKEGIDICIRSRENFILSRPIHQWNRENVKKMEKKWEEEEEGEGPKGGGWG